MTNPSGSQKLVRLGTAALVFATALKVVATISELKDVIEVWELAEKHWPKLDSIPNWVGPMLAVSMSGLFAYAVNRYWRRRQIRNFKLPDLWEPALGYFQGDRRLSFRYANNPRDIAELAKTEDYEVYGTSNVNIATDWWKEYPQGNRLAIYRDQIIGGIDIWPLTKMTYDQLVVGEITDIELRPKHFRPRPRRNGSYWYAGSISVAEVWRRDRVRKELVVRLIIDTLQSWLIREPTFPVRVAALAWTRAGRNLLRRNGFVFHTAAKTGRHNDEVYVREFEARSDVEDFIETLKSRLVEHAPHPAD